MPTRRSTTSKSRLRSTAKPQIPQRTMGLVLVLLMVAVVAGIFLFITKFSELQSFQNARGEFKVAQPVTIEGTLLFTALKPDPNDKGEIDLKFREMGKLNWQSTKVMIPLQQNATWQWPQALPGKNYELQAVLLIDGKEIKKSEVVPVTAPAEAVELPLEVNWRDLPKDVVKASTTELAGDVTVNGIIPANAILEVYALSPKSYEKAFHQVTVEDLSVATKLASVTHPQPITHWSWLQAKPLEKYFVVAVLKQGNQILGSSLEILNADAGEAKLQHTINSSATQSQTINPTPKKTIVLGASTELAQLSAGNTNGLTSISGVVTLQGPKEKDTSLLMLWRKLGAASYNVINRYMYPPASGQVWRWDQAVPGQQYDISAALQVNNNNTSTLPSGIIVTAPASNIKMNLNTWYVIPGTNQQPVNEVCIDNNGNQATAVIRLPQMANAAQYWVQVGAGNGGSDVYNQKVPANPGSDVKVQVRVLDGKMNFMRYSYAVCEHCSSDTNFAPFSSTVQFVCN
jgi:hypothetical protein